MSLASRQRKKKSHKNKYLILYHSCQRASLYILPASLSLYLPLSLSHQINQSIPWWLEIMQSLIKKKRSVSALIKGEGIHVGSRLQAIRLSYSITLIRTALAL